MDDAPERIWLSAADGDNEHEVWFDPDEGGTMYVRADLYEQVKRERDELASAFNSSCEIRERLASRAEAAERLAGARVVPVTQGPYEARICKDIPADCCDYGVVSLSEGREVCRVWREQDARAIAAVLAEPAGEAEPKILIHEPMAWTGEGPYGFSPVATPSDASAIRGALPATGPYVDRLIRIFRNRPDDDTSAVVLQDYARAALAGAKS